MGLKKFLKTRRRTTPKIVEILGINTPITQQPELPTTTNFSFARRTTAGVSTETFPAGSATQAWDLLYVTIAILKTASANLRTDIIISDTLGSFRIEFFAYQSGAFNLVFDLKGITLFNGNTLQMQVATNDCDALAINLAYTIRTLIHAQ